MTTIAIGCDHAGFPFKEPIKAYLTGLGYQILDFGTNDTTSADYPDFAHPTALAVSEGRAERGILMCGSANGVAITANKHQNIRCGLCWHEDVAVLVRLHNDANMLALPARFITLETALRILDIFLTTEFEGGRHATRVGKIAC
jgi:ribose 5-phosphate isomerase B